MKKAIAGGVGVAAALMVVFGSGSASAVNEYAGQTYDKATQAISSAGQTAVIATKEGSYLPLAQCEVVGSRTASFLDSSGQKQGGKVLLDLNCNDTSALNGHPGNSVTTPEGGKVHQTQNTAKQINQNYADATAAGQKSWCELNSSDCAQFCNNAGQGLCSPEVMQLLGA
jgi:hypothetical protein